MQTRTTPRKKKNLVASKLTSPPHPPLREVVIETDDDNLSVGSSSTTSTSKRQYTLFPFELGKDLCEIVESNGGIATFGGSQQKLAHLLDEQPSLPFGSRSDKIRTTCRKKVYDWQRYHREGTYRKKVLDHYNVKSAEDRRKEAKKSASNPKKPILQPKVKPDDEDLVDAFKSLGISHTTPKSPIAPPIAPRTPPPKVVFASSHPSPSPLRSSSKSVAKMSAMSAMIAKGRPTKPKPWPSAKGEMPPPFTGKCHDQVP